MMYLGNIVRMDFSLGRENVYSQIDEYVIANMEIKL